MLVVGSKVIMDVFHVGMVERATDDSKTGVVDRPLNYRFLGPISLSDRNLLLEEPQVRFRFGSPEVED